MRVLLVETDEDQRTRLMAGLEELGANVLPFDLDAGDRVETLTFDVAVIDVGARDGAALLGRVRTARPSAPIVVLSRERSPALELVHGRGGKTEYLVKPCSVEQLQQAIAKLSRHEPTAPAPVDLDAWRNEHVPELLGRDPRLLRVFEVMRRIASSDCSVLITGETGTGKELIATGLHRASARSRDPFVALNCAAIPETLMESELFGHARGAFTGAHTAHRGRLAQADGGTLLLDEIGEMPATLQAKLLRVLQEGEVHAVGESRPTRIDVRVVAATHRDLDEMVRAGTFREDLLYRLDVIRIEVPPLRARRGDIPELIAAFLSRASARWSVPMPRVEQEALELLCSYEWPGNVRQLQHAVERLILLCSRDVIRVEDLPARFQEVAAREPSSKPDEASPRLPEEGLDLRDAVEQFENSLILQALQRTGWNKNQAAAMLQLNRTTLVEKLKKRGWSGG